MTVNESINKFLSVNMHILIFPQYLKFELIMVNIHAVSIMEHAIQTIMHMKNIKIWGFVGWDSS